MATEPNLRQRGIYWFIYWVVLKRWLQAWLDPEAQIASSHLFVWWSVCLLMWQVFSTWSKRWVPEGPDSCSHIDNRRDVLTFSQNGCSLGRTPAHLGPCAVGLNLSLSSGARLHQGLASTNMSPRIRGSKVSLLEGPGSCLCPLGFSLSSSDLHLRSWHPVLVTLDSKPQPGFYTGVNWSISLPGTSASHQ